MLSSILSFISQFQLLILFGWAFIASLGFPGALVVMMSWGALAQSIPELFPIMLVVIIASILGDIFAYELARKFSELTKKKLEKYSFFRKGEERARDILKHHAFSSVFFTRFALTSLGAVVSYISGFEKIKRKTFLTAVVCGEILYGTLYPVLGFLFKETWNDLSQAIHDIIIIVVLSLIVGYLSYYVFKKERMYLKKRLLQKSK